MKHNIKFIASIFLFLFITHSAIAETSDSLEVNVINTDTKVGNLRFIVRDSSNLILRVMDEDGTAFKTLNKNQVSISRENKNAKIIKVVPLNSTIETNLNIVLTLDNSSSMQPHRKELLSSVELLLNALKGKSRISVVVFSESSSDNLKSTIGEKVVNISKLDFTDDFTKISKFINRSYNSNELTQKTYLHDGILVAFQQFAKMPKNMLRIMIVFSDGKDLGSKYKQEHVFAAATDAGITVYGIDFSRDPGANKIMKKLPPITEQGKYFRAARSADLRPIFDELSKEIITEFQVTYHFPIPPKGDIQFTDDALTITTRRLTDEFPMLNYVFFDSSSAEIDKRYFIFSSKDECENFNEKSIQKPMNKYYHILNVIGSRAQQDTEAKLTITGCNMNLGVEKGNLTLSKQRAEAVSLYLQNIWGIESSRIKILTRNLPAKRSSIRTAEGLAENRRVEIASNHYNILKPISSEVVENVYNPEIGYFNTTISAPEGLKNYEFLAFNNNTNLVKVDYNESKNKISWNWIGDDGEKISQISEINYFLKIRDNDGRTFESKPKVIPIQQIDESATQKETNQDSTFEKFSLVLFGNKSGQHI